MTASGDVITTLSSRVSELSKRVSILQAELEAAQRRIAVYEEHDATIQEAIASALRAAYTIREQAETTAGQILEQAREERRVLLHEIDRLREERDSVQEEIAEQRRGGIAAVAPPPLSSDAAVAELRAVASEALRGLFQELVDDLRATSPRGAAAGATPDVPASPPAAAKPTERAATSPPLEVVSPHVEIEEIAQPRAERADATSEVQLVLKPVQTFARLVEIERHIQSLPVVRTLYVRDFRAGSATLAVALRSAMPPGEFASALAGLVQPRMRVVSTSRGAIELQIEGEASIA